MQHGRLATFRALAEVVLLPAVLWLAPWLVFLYAANATDVHVVRSWLAAALVVLANAYVLLGVLLRKRARDLPRGYVFAGFVFTLAALVGAYACADIAASRADIGCYADVAHPGRALGRLDSVYYALTTLTTTGFGDISAHSATCRGLAVAELAIGLPAIGLSVAAVGARLFREA